MWVLPGRDGLVEIRLSIVVCVFVSLWVGYGMQTSQESLQKAFHVAIRQLQELQVRGMLCGNVDSSSSRNSVGLFESEVGVQRVGLLIPLGHLHSNIGNLYKYYRPLSVDIGGVNVVVDMGCFYSLVRLLCHV